MLEGRRSILSRARQLEGHMGTYAEGDVGRGSIHGTSFRDLNTVTLLTNNGTLYLIFLSGD